MPSNTTTNRRRPLRPDASMSLLSDLMSNTVDEGYVEAAQRKAAEQPPVAPRRRLRPGLIAGVIIVGMLLAAAAMQVRDRAPAAAQARTALVDEIQGRTEQTDELQRRMETLLAEVEAARTDALALSTSGDDAAATLERMQLLAGTIPVTGPGVRITVDDPAPGAAADGSMDSQADTSRVLDRDLQLVVNGLWAAGAEAIAINGQRITSRTAIRSAGEAILVDYRPLTRPYQIEAIGDPGSLEASFVEGPGGQLLQTLADYYGIRYGLETVDEGLRLPAGSGSDLRSAQAVDPAGGQPPMSPPNGPDSAGASP